MESILQTDFWATFKEQWGWHGHRAAGVLALEKSLPLGRSFLYSPEVTSKPEVLLDLLPEIRQIAERRHAVFFRLELLIDKKSPEAERWLAALHYTHFQKAFEEIQPADRQIVSLEGDETKVLAGMKQKGRYNIRIALRSGLVVRESTPATLSADTKMFHDLMLKTAKRDHFSVRPLEYFQTLNDTLYTQNTGRQFIASFQDEPLAAAIITLHDGVASYLYGASGDDKRNFMAPYGVHFAAIQYAMSQNAKAYDLLAVRPEGPGKHHWDGITRFKQQFGGDEKHYLGSYDFVFQPTYYQFFGLAEKIRRPH